MCTHTCTLTSTLAEQATDLLQKQTNMEGGDAASASLTQCCPRLLASLSPPKWPPCPLHGSARAASHTLIQPRHLSKSKSVLYVSYQACATIQGFGQGGADSVAPDGSKVEAPACARVRVPICCGSRQREKAVIAGCAWTGHMCVLVMPLAACHAGMHAMKLPPTSCNAGQQHGSPPPCRCASRKLQVGAAERPQLQNLLNTY